jgi:CO/xanthine dehydrogenase FAD-binding subunit
LIPRMEYRAFSDPAAAVKFAASQKGRSRYMGGGTDLMVQLRSGKAKAEYLIDVSAANGLSGIKDEGDSIMIGAFTTIEEVRRSSVVAKELVALKEASDLFAAWQVRNLATLGGNLCNASPAADSAPPLLAYGAQLSVRRGDDEVTIPLEKFFLGPGKTVLHDGDLVTRVSIPKPRGGCAFVKLGKRQASILAVVSVAALVSLSGEKVGQVRVFLGSVAPTPVRATHVEAYLYGRIASEENLRAAAKLVSRDIKPIGDVRASAAYREKMAVLLTEKALRTAMERAGGE